MLRRKFGEQRVEAIWGDRQLPQSAGPAERIVDRRSDRGPSRCDAGFARTFDADSEGR